MKRLCIAISGVAVTVTAFTPLALCFGFLADSPEAYVHRVIVVGVVSFCTFLATFVAGNI